MSQYPRPPGSFRLQAGIRAVFINQTQVTSILRFESCPVGHSVSKCCDQWVGEELFPIACILALMPLFCVHNCFLCIMIFFKDLLFCFYQTLYKCLVTFIYLVTTIQKPRAINLQFKCLNILYLDGSSWSACPLIITVFCRPLLAGLGFSVVILKHRLDYKRAWD